MVAVFIRSLFRVILPVSVLMLFFSGAAFAQPSATLTTIQTTVAGSIKSIVGIIGDIALLAGIGFILASLFKFDQHKKNPQQVQMSQPIALFLVGAGLTLFPLVVNTAATSLYGTTVQGNTLTTLLGS